MSKTVLLRETQRFTRYNHSALTEIVNTGAFMKWNARREGLKASMAGGRTRAAGRTLSNDAN